MSSKQPSIRPRGQRAITSTVLFGSSNRLNDCKKEVEKKNPTQMGSQLSLSDFLTRKLQKTSVKPPSQGKKQPFLSPLSCVGSACAVGLSAKDGGEADANMSIDGVLQMLIDDKGKKDCMKSSAPNDNDDLGRPRNRTNLFEGLADKPSARSVLAVLGDDSRPTQSRKRKNVPSKEESKPLFNHYESGGGWWDNNMEGIDSEEVGCSNVWEGIGCTTLGGIEWH